MSVDKQKLIKNVTTLNKKERKFIVWYLLEKCGIQKEIIKESNDGCRLDLDIVENEILLQLNKLVDALSYVKKEDRISDSI